MIPLPKPDRLIPAIRLDARRSTRDFKDRELALDRVSVLLFAAQGCRHGEDKRVVPSAGARYPLELTLAVRRVEALQPGLYRHSVDRHGLDAVETNGDPLPKIAAATFEAPWVANAAAVLHISAVLSERRLPMPINRRSGVPKDTYG